MSDETGGTKMTNQATATNGGEVVVGYTLSVEEIVAEAERQEIERQAAATRAVISAGKTDVKVGRFTANIATGVISGPAAYMNSQAYATKIARIMAGEDTVTNMGVCRGGDMYTAMLVSLQTDFAAWLGMRQFNAQRA